MGVRLDMHALICNIFDDSDWLTLGAGVHMRRRQTPPDHITQQTGGTDGPRHTSSQRLPGDPTAGPIWKPTKFDCHRSGVHRLLSLVIHSWRPLAIFMPALAFGYDSSRCSQRHLRDVSSTWTLAHLRLPQPDRTVLAIASYLCVTCGRILFVIRCVLHDVRPGYSNTIA